MSVERGILEAVARADIIAVTAARVLRMMIAVSAAVWIAWGIVARTCGRDKE